MEQQPTSLAERRSTLEAAREALAGLGSVLHQASGPELAELMTLADEVSAGAGAARVSVTVEAVARGEVAQAGVNVHAWVRDHAPSLRQGGAGAVAAVATAVAPAGSTWRPEGGDLDPHSPLGIVWAGVSQGVVSPGLAVGVLREVQRLEPQLTVEATPTVTRALLDLGVQWGPAQMRRLRPRLLAEQGLPGVLDDLQQRLAPAARLSSPMVESGDLTEYQLWMTPEQAAVLEAAIGPLSAPAPNDETGERDLRPAGQRRVEALTDVCRRSSGLDADESGGGDGTAGAACAVVWDLNQGSYDRHLERLRAERSANDPPPLTPERLRSLLEAITGDDPDEQRWADHELSIAQPDHGDPLESWEDQDWADDLRREREQHAA